MDLYVFSEVYLTRVLNIFPAQTDLCCSYHGFFSLLLSNDGFSERILSYQNSVFCCSRFSWLVLVAWFLYITGIAVKKTQNNNHQKSIILSRPLKLTFWFPTILRLSCRTACMSFRDMLFLDGE